MLKKGGTNSIFGVGNSITSEFIRFQSTWNEKMVVLVIGECNMKIFKKISK